MPSSATAPQHPSQRDEVCAVPDDEHEETAPGPEGEHEPSVVAGAPRRRLRLVGADESGTTTAEYTVVTAAAVGFGALLLKLLTGGWGQRILEVAFRGVIKMLGF